MGGNKATEEELRALVAQDSSTLPIFEWIKTDYLGFKDRLGAADEAFLGDLENLALNRVRQQKPSDNPTLLIMLLKWQLVR